MTGNGMRAGVVLPGGTATEQLEQAVAAERAGWDGVFVWEAGYGVDARTPHDSPERMHEIAEQIAAGPPA